MWLFKLIRVCKKRPWLLLMACSLSTVAYRRHVATQNLANIGSVNGLLPSGTKPLPKPTMTIHQLSVMAFTWGRFHMKYLGYILLWKLPIQNFRRIELLMAQCAFGVIGRLDFMIERQTNYIMDHDLLVNSLKSSDHHNWLMKWLLAHSKRAHCFHYCNVIMGSMASLVTSLTSVYSTVHSSADQRKHQSSASLVFVRGIHRRPVNSPHKWPVTRKMFDDVIMWTSCLLSTLLLTTNLMELIEIHSF